MLEINNIYNMDCLVGLKRMAAGSVNCCVTSPPYFGLRDYGNIEQIGLEETPEEYVLKIVEVFREVKRVLSDDGTLWLNLGDSYSGSGKGRMANGLHCEGGKQATNIGTTEGILVKTQIQLPAKNLIGIPWMVAFALRADGWYLRQDIIWAKPNPMPESVRDRCTKSHEYIFMLSKKPKYYYDAAAISEPVTESTKMRLSQNVEDQIGSDRAQGKNGNMKAKAPRYGGNKYATGGFNRTKSGNIYEISPDAKRNKRSVWTISTKPFKEAHFATFPQDLIEPCILAGCPRGGVVLDPFMGAGTTSIVSIKNNRNYIGFELSEKYCEIANKRIADATAQVRFEDYDPSIG